MNPISDIPNPLDLKRSSLIGLVWRLISTVKKLWEEVATLRTENEELKRKNARSAAPFSRNKRKKNPKRPGRKAGQGSFRNRTAPPEQEYSGPIEEVPVQETSCPAIPGLEILPNKHRHLVHFEGSKKRAKNVEIPRSKAQNPSIFNADLDQPSQNSL